MDKNIVKILKDIERGYDLIADKFSSTRKFFWESLSFIGDEVEEGNRILDFGCGNGRLLEILKDKSIDYTGVDVSGELIRKAKEKYPDFKGNFSKIEVEESLSFPENYFNVIFSLAVFHHFPPEYQKTRLEELYRFLRPGGKIILTVWNLNKDNIRESKRWKKISNNEAYISFSDNKGKIFSRYHFIFSEESLWKLLEETGFNVERCDTIDGVNILIIARKK